MPLRALLTTGRVARLLVPVLPIRVALLLVRFVQVVIDVADAPRLTDKPREAHIVEILVLQQLLLYLEG